MGRIIDALKAGFRDTYAPKPYSVAGRPVRCPHCGETSFTLSRALLNTRGASLVNLDWANPYASTLICAECGRIEWFDADPSEIEAGS
jgi:hypothetical protein